MQYEVPTLHELVCNMPVVGVAVAQTRFALRQKIAARVRARVHCRQRACSAVNRLGEEALIRRQACQRLIIREGYV